MNYRHAFHAGNAADVFKHAMLTRVLSYLVRKPGALLYLDTHAGLGRYDLGGADAARTGEWRSGIGHPALLAPPPAVRDLLQPYFNAVGPRDHAGRPFVYPGSPAIAQAILRPHDRLVFCELHPDDAAALTAYLGRDRRVKTVERDGYQALKAFVPPLERRGLVLIDPPFEDRAEFERLTASLTAAWRKWPTGTYMMWYPIKDLTAVARWSDDLVETGLRRLLRFHLLLDRPSGAQGSLSGSGLIVVNPPFTLQAEAEAILPFLADALGVPGRSSWSTETLAGE